MKARFHITPHEVEDGWYAVTCREMPGCASQGRSVSSALRNYAEDVMAWEGR
jgi:predicted RNase H-like HicB family nuclease